MKIKQLTEILNVDVRRVARQYFKRDVDVDCIIIRCVDDGGHQISVEFSGGESLNFEFDCHGHKLYPAD